MISFASPLPIGDAVKVGFLPLAGAVQTIVLRNVVDVFAGHADPACAVVYQGVGETFFIDDLSLINGTPYYYHQYDTLDGVTWSDGGLPSVSATPAATAVDSSVDVLEILRERLEAGLRVEVAAGRLVHDMGYVPVLTAPPLADNVVFPIVTVHMRNDAPSVRGIGEMVEVDFPDLNGTWEAGEGWLSNYQLDIGGWVTGNPDTRIALRKAIKKVIIGNLPLFDQRAILLPVLTMSDTEDFESYAAPMYMAMGSFTCLAPSMVSKAGIEPISDVTVAALAA